MRNFSEIDLGQFAPASRGRIELAKSEVVPRLLTYEEERLFMVVIFGSAAKNLAHQESDIDLAVAVWSVPLMDDQYNKLLRDLQSLATPLSWRLRRKPEVDLLLTSMAELDRSGGSIIGDVANHGIVLWRV